MRSGEICGLTPEDVDGRVARLRQTKNGTSRSVPLSARAAEIVKIVKAVHAGGPLFGISDQSRDVLFRRAVKATGIEGLTFHDARHEAITRLAKKLQVLDLARMTGHKDIRQLMIYYNESAADIALRL